MDRFRTLTPKLKLAAAFAAIYLIWGSTFLAIRYAIETVPPLLMMGTRALLAGTAIYGFARLRGRTGPDSPTGAARRWRESSFSW